MGPQGMREVGEYIIANAHYAKAKLEVLEGITVPLTSTPFVEVVVNFDATGLTVAEINKALLGHGIFGGHDISREYPVLGQSALYCFTDVITKSDIDRLAEALQEIIA
jgi:glycine dehydrogenase subunit 1